MFATWIMTNVYREIIEWWTFVLGFKFQPSQEIQCLWKWIGNTMHMFINSKYYNLWVNVHEMWKHYDKENKWFHSIWKAVSPKKKIAKYHLCLLALSFFKASQKHCQYRMLFLSSGKSNNRLLFPLCSNLINQLA